MITARSYCGQDVLENIRIRVTLKRPPEEDARQEKERVQDEASYTVVCRMLPHALSDRTVSHTGEHLLLRDQQVRRLGRGDAVFQYEIEIFELVSKNGSGILESPGFAADGDRLYADFPD